MADRSQGTGLRTTHRSPGGYIARKKFRPRLAGKQGDASKKEWELRHAIHVQVRRMGILGT